MFNEQAFQQHQEQARQDNATFGRQFDQAMKDDEFRRQQQRQRRAHGLNSAIGSAIVGIMAVALVRIIVK